MDKNLQRGAQVATPEGDRGTVMRVQATAIAVAWADGSALRGFQWHELPLNWLTVVSR